MIGGFRSRTQKYTFNTHQPCVHMMFIYKIIGVYRSADGIFTFQVRDRTLSRIKSNIELMVDTNGGNKAVIIPHSMGVLYFLHFMKWVEAPAPMGGGGGPDWCAKHIKAVMNIGGPLLGVPKAVSGLFSSEARDIAVAR